MTVAEKEELIRRAIVAGCTSHQEIAERTSLPQTTVSGRLNLMYGRYNAMGVSALRRALLPKSAPAAAGYTIDSNMSLEQLVDLHLDIFGEVWCKRLVAGLGQEIERRKVDRGGKMMNASTYQELAARTLIDKPDFEISDKDIMVIWNAIGLAGEAGEVCEEIKKGIFHQHGLDREKLYKELGDVCWYLAALCTKLNFDLSEVMQTNIDKLMLRYPTGYSSAASKQRIDTERKDRP